MTSTSPRTKSTARTTSAVGDKVFFGLSWTGGAIILVVLAFVAAFLLIEALPAIMPETFGPGADQAIDFWSYVWPLMAGTVMVSVIALLLATPVAIGISLFISHYAPRRFANPIGYLIDLLAAIPRSSTVHGACLYWHPLWCRSTTGCTTIWALSRCLPGTQTLPTPVARL